jgi:lipoprotein Spr
MLRLKITISALALTIFVLFSTNSFAFNTPKEFASLGTKNISHGHFLNTADNKLSAGSAKPESIKTALLSQYTKWKGTHYRWGGTSHKGVDCSALMQHIFSESLHTDLPRSTFQQIKNGQRVDKAALKAGDLVFFKTRPGVRHVGVYLGNAQFMHASSSQGVTISSLSSEYWDSHYETARRLAVTAGQAQA